MPQVQGWLFCSRPRCWSTASSRSTRCSTSFVLSFQKWNGLDADAAFVGLANYRYIFTEDPVFWVAFKNTLIWTALCRDLPDADRPPARARPQPDASSAAATLRAIFYLPVIIAPIAVATMWRWMYDPFFGLFSQVLTNWALRARSRTGSATAKIALYSVFVAHLWQTVGFSMVLFLAGLQGVSQTLVEAARIDGAGRWASSATSPCRRSRTTITIVLILVDHQLAEGLRHRLRHDRRRPGAVDADAGAVGLHPGDADLRLRPRRRDLGGAARDHHRRSSSPTCAGRRSTRRPER